MRIIAVSLEAVHTHTHTHTHNIFNEQDNKEINNMNKEKGSDIDL